MFEFDCVVFLLGPKWGAIGATLIKLFFSFLQSIAIIILCMLFQALFKYSNFNKPFFDLGIVKI
jgi:hypothetical protein